MPPTSPADMDDEQLEAAFLRLCRARAGASPTRLNVVTRILDVVLDEKAARCG